MPPLRFASRARRSVVALAASVIAAGCATGAHSSPPVRSHGTAVLVVGDSLVAAAAGALTGQTPAGVTTRTLAGIGASPCDLWAGYRQPGPAGPFLSFTDTVRSEHPRAVVLAFTGNPGISPGACVTQASTAYSLATLIAAYRQALTEMGDFAAGMGARVYLSATPARNPAVPEGWDGLVQHGYNGDPALNAMMSDLADARRWTYDTGAAGAISGPGLGWTLHLPCQPADATACVRGQVQVRFGGPDAIHCDVPGTNGSGSSSAGALRYAYGLLLMPLADQGHRPTGLGRGRTPAAPTTTAPTTKSGTTTCTT